MLRSRFVSALTFALTVATLGSAVGCAPPEDDAYVADDPGSPDTLDQGTVVLGQEPSGEAATYPIVLAHGFMASPTNFWAFYGVEDALEADGHDVYVAEVPAFASSEVRALALADFIDEVLAETGADKVHLITHSMGGLDAMIVASPGGLGYGDRLASVTTIGTAHRGTVLADAYLGLVPGFGDTAIDAVLEFLGDHVLSTQDAEANLREAMESLGGIAHPAEIGRPDGPTSIIEAYPDDPDLYYQSWAGVSTVLGRDPGDMSACDGKILMNPGKFNRTHVMLWSSASLSAAFEDGPSDGMIQVSSTKHGNFRGCVPADHLDLVGQIGNDGPNRHTGFDHIRWYRNMAFDLAAREGR